MSARLHTDIEIVSKSNVASSGNKDSSTLSLSAGLFFFDQQATRDDYAFPSSLVPLVQNEWKTNVKNLNLVPITFIWKRVWFTSKWTCMRNTE